MFTSSCMMCYDHISFLVQPFVFSELSKCFSPTCLVFHVPVPSSFLHALKLSSQTFLQTEAHQTVHQFHFPSGVLPVLAERSCSVCQRSLCPSFSAPLPAIPASSLLVGSSVSWTLRLAFLWRSPSFRGFLGNREVGNLFKDSCAWNALTLPSQQTTGLTAEFWVKKDFTWIPKVLLHHILASGVAVLKWMPPDSWSLVICILSGNF